MVRHRSSSRKVQDTVDSAIYNTFTEAPPKNCVVHLSCSPSNLKAELSTTLSNVSSSAFGDVIAEQGSEGLIVTCLPDEELAWVSPYTYSGQWHKGPCNQEGASKQCNKKLSKESQQWNVRYDVDTKDATIDLDNPQGLCYDARSSAMCNESRRMPRFCGKARLSRGSQYDEVAWKGGWSGPTTAVSRAGGTQLGIIALDLTGDHYRLDGRTVHDTYDGSIPVSISVSLA